MLASEGNLLSSYGLRFALQRIALAQWQPNLPLRSGAAAPLHVVGDDVFVPCEEDEAIWLRAWLEGAERGWVTVHDPATRARGVLHVPRDVQLTTLEGEASSPLQRRGKGERALVVDMIAELEGSVLQRQFRLRLLDPAAFAERASRGLAPLSARSLFPSLRFR